ncbi:MAG: amidohydrolase [Chitinophagales bacterium]
MTNSLRITVFQTNIIWENPTENLVHYGETLLQLQANETDVLVLPEMFATGFTMNAAAVAETMDGQAVHWMQSQAQRLNCAVTGSLVMEENGQYFNRMLWVLPDGSQEHYDKRHLFRMAKEHHTYEAGNAQKTVNYKGWNIRLQVCYDLRFPVFSRNAAPDTANHYDLMIYVANWPAVRRYPWQTLLKARAIENLAYVVGVNRVGKDGKGFTYSGDSAVIDYKGEVLWEKSHNAALHTHTLGKQALSDFRQKFPAWMDADGFELKI